MQLGTIGLGRRSTARVPGSEPRGDFDVASDTMLDFTSKMET
jgi:hypothetical protein